MPLDDVVARAERVALGVEEREHALALVLAKLLPEQWQGGADKRAEHEDHAQPETGEQDDDGARGADQDGRAEVRLPRDEQHGRQDDARDGGQ